MIKSIFVDPTELTGLENSGANHLIVNFQNLEEEYWKKLQQLRVTLGISVNAFGSDGCPANPQAQKLLFEKIEKALTFEPSELWIDHFRFDGHWEMIQGAKIPEIHSLCEYCSRVPSRAEFLKQIAEEILQAFGKKVKIGYFAVPFKGEEVPDLVTGLGQDLMLGKIFDMTSPMLYQQMIRKPITYISEYVDWLHRQTQKPVLPIIQVQSMPEILEDTITKNVLQKEFEEAIKQPSSGVSFFMWTQAVKVHKTKRVAQLFSRIA